MRIAFVTPPGHAVLPAAGAIVTLWLAGLLYFARAEAQAIEER